LERYEHVWKSNIDEVIYDNRLQ